MRYGANLGESKASFVSKQENEEMESFMILEEKEDGLKTHPNLENLSWISFPLGPVKEFNDVSNPSYRTITSLKLNAPLNSQKEVLIVENEIRTRSAAYS